MATRLLPADLPASLFHENPDAIAVYDRDGLFVSCNAAALQMTGSSPEQFSGTSYTDRVSAPDRPRIEEAFQRALEGGTDHFESSIREASGAIVPVEVYVFPARLDGAIAGVFVRARDAAAQRFRSLFEYHPDAMAALNLDGTIARVNAAFEAATGRFGEHLAGRPWTDVLAPECRRAAEDGVRLAHRGEAVEFEAHLLDRAGNRIEVAMKLVPLRAGGRIEGAYAIARDVTAQRAAEHAMALQGERIRQLYLAAATRGQSLDEQIENTLSLGCRLFDFDYGYVTRFKDAAVVIQSAAGEGAGVRAGMLFPKRNALSRLVEGERQSVFIPDLDEPPWNTDPARYSAPWRSYYAAKLVVNGEDYGALVFAGREPHHVGLVQLDRDLLEMMALFVSAAIERSMHAERIEQLAFYDALTGLPNRALFADRIDQTLTAAKRYNRGFSVMYLDLDAFKEINDRYGHPAGDLLLRSVAERLSAICRESDTIARFGGDEFVILQPVVNGTGDASDLAGKIVEGMQRPFTINGNECVAHTSIGIALFPKDGVTAEELMEHADRALYRAKRAGRNRWQFFAESDIAR